MGEVELNAELLRIYPELFTYARYLTRNLRDAEDVLHESLVRCLAHRRSVRIDTLTPYVRRIVTNEFLRLMRRRGRERQTVAAEPVQHHHDTFHNLSSIQMMLAVLTPRERVAVINRYYLDLSEKDTAQSMGCSIGTVKTLSSRGLGKLRQHLLPATSTANIDTDSARK